MNKNPFDSYGGTSDSAVRGGLCELPMNWYKFLIYFALWISAAVNLMSAFTYITGRAQTEEVLAAFPALGAIDIGYGILTFGMAILALLTRYALANRKRHAPRLTVTLYTYGMVISAVYNIAVLCLTHSSYEQVELIVTVMSVCTSLILNAVMIACNHVYFKKRKSMFNK